MAKMDKWNESDVSKLISCFKQHAVLWAPNHSQYGKRGPRSFAMKKVASQIPDRG